MIVRDGRRNVSANTPAPAHIDSVRAVNTIALAAEAYVSPVERRYLTPEELAVIRQSDPEPVRVPQPVYALTVTPDLPERRARGGRNAALTRSRIIGRPRLFTDAELFDALIHHRGSQSRAALALGFSRSAIRKRIRHLRDTGTMPAEVSAVLRGPGGHWRWEAA